MRPLRGWSPRLGDTTASRVVVWSGGAHLVRLWMEKPVRLCPDNVLMVRLVLVIGSDPVLAGVRIVPSRKEGSVHELDTRQRGTTPIDLQRFISAEYSVSLVFSFSFLFQLSEKTK